MISHGFSSRLVIVVLFGLWLSPAPATAQYKLGLRPKTITSHNVQAVMDVGAVRARSSPNPYRYDCVAFLQVRNEAGQSATLAEVGAAAWSPERITVHPAGDPSRGQHPSMIRILGPNNQRITLLVVLTPEQTDVEYVVRVDSARIIDPAGPDTVLHDLNTEPFPIPSEVREKCGRVPSFDVRVMDPGEGNGGFNVALSAYRRQAVNRSRAGMWELFADGSIATSDSLELLNTLTAGGRLDLALTSGWEHWVSVGLVGRVEATEDLDVVDRVFGATARVRLDFLGVDELIRPFIRKFAPYPMLTLEYNNVARWKGEGEPEIADRNSSENRFRANLEWSLPLILSTTVHMKFRADYFLSKPPEGMERFHSVRDISVEYPLNGSGDLVAVVTWLRGEAAPTFTSVSEVLVGLGIRR